MIEPFSQCYVSEEYPVKFGVCRECFDVMFVQHSCYIYICQTNVSIIWCEKCSKASVKQIIYTILHAAIMCLPDVFDCKTDYIMRTFNDVLYKFFLDIFFMSGCFSRSNAGMNTLF